MMTVFDGTGRTPMAVIPLMGQEEVQANSGVMKPEILGWDVLQSNPSTAPVPALTVRHLRTVEGPTTLVSTPSPSAPRARSYRDYNGLTHAG